MIKLFTQLQIFSSIRSKLITLLWILVGFPLLIAGYLSYQSATDALLNQTTQQLGNLADKTAQQIGIFFRTAQKDINLLADYPFIQLAFLQYEFKQRLDTMQRLLADYSKKNDQKEVVMLKKLTLFVCAVCFGVTAMAAYPREAGAGESLIIATATTGGTYYPVGVAIGTLISVKLAKNHKITATAINSAGSGENVQMLKNKEVQLAILQSLFGLEAYNGKGAYEGKAVQDFRSVTMLWENVEHFVMLSKYAKTGTVDDLKLLGKKFSIGKRGSGTEGSGRALLGALGIDPEKEMTLEYLAYTPSVQAMMNGRIVGANIPAGPPVAAITQLYAQLGDKRVNVLKFTDEQLATVRKAYPIWNRFVVKAGTYPGQKQEIRTISQPNFLAVHPDVSEETVYLITKTIYENLPFLGNIHKATHAMSLEKAIAGLPVPLHPGAAKYYTEQGIKIPDAIMPR